MNKFNYILQEDLQKDNECPLCGDNLNFCVHGISFFEFGLVNSFVVDPISKIPIPV
jgi:hypothetical protein